MPSPPRTIIGIDPGTSVLGYAIIDIISANVIHLQSVGVVQLQKYDNHYVKLKKIFEKVTFLLDTYHPHEMAIEAPFYGENVQSMIKLGRAQGVAMAAAAMKDMPIAEYSPRKIKQSITGNGNASKEQVAAMLKNMLRLDALPTYFDATDALGVAVCHYLQNRLGGIADNDNSAATRHKDWKSFLQNNPNRLKKKN